MRPILTMIALLLPTVALADPKDDARRHFKMGLEAVAEDEPDYNTALQHFLAAQEAYPHPATLYNIARTYTDLNQLENALVYYRQFRDAAPDKAADVDPVISVIEARLGQDVAPVVGTGGGPAAGTTTVVVTGPTAEELARLQAISAELEALSRAINDRAEADKAAAVAGAGTATGDGTDEVDPANVGQDGQPIDGGEDGTINLPTTGFLEAAYERVVVTASRYGQEPLDSPSTITILTSEDLRISGATNIPDALRRVVGVDVMSPASSHAEISIRGFNRELNNKVLVLIDGRSTYIDFVGTTFWSGLPITIEEIERIEIIRGPGSAVYGANAMTGVINIITKAPGDYDVNSAHVDSGFPGLGRGTLMTSGTRGDTSWRATAGYRQMGRWAKDYRLQPDDSVQAFFPDQNTATETVRANLRVDRSFGNKGFAWLQGGFSDGFYEFYNIGALGDYGVEDNHTYLRFDAGYDPIHVRAFWNRNDMYTGPWTESESTVRTLNQKLDSDVVDFEIEAPTEFKTGDVEHKFNAGLGYRFKHTKFGYLEGGFRNPFEENHYSFFLSEEATLKRIKGVGTLRIDRHPLLPLSQTISPRLSGIVRMAKATSARVTGGTAFRAPNMLENYMLFDLNTSADGVFIRDYGGIPFEREDLGKRLNPERILTVEAGLHDESSLYHIADVAVYMNQVSGLIGLQSMTPGINAYDPVSNGIEVGYSGWVNNDPTYQGVGLEAETELFPMDGMDIFANVDVQTITETDGNQKIQDKSTSLLKTNVGWTYRTPYNTDISLQGHYVSDQVWRLREFDAAGQIVINEAELPARFLSTARVGVRPLEGEKLEFAATVWNIGGLFSDTDVREHPKGQPLQPVAFGSVDYSF